MEHSLEPSNIRQDTTNFSANKLTARREDCTQSGTSRLRNMRGVADMDRLTNRRTAMDDGINPFEHRDVACSGRSLATLLVAWVGAAMVASVLLRWKYMWIALTILTLLFLFACGYAACSGRRANSRAELSEDARIIERRRREMNIQSVSGGVDNCAEVTDPPTYPAYWITDLPPPYAVVVGTESPSAPRRALESDPTTSSRLSNPPPYSVAIQSEANAACAPISSVSASNRVPAGAVNHAGTSSPERRHSIVDEAAIERRDRFVENPIAWDEDKAVTERPGTNDHNSQNNSHTVLATGTQYLSNIISCTFGRGSRRNTDRNNTVHATTTRDRPDISQSSTIDVSSQETGSTINASTL